MKSVLFFLEDADTDPNGLVSPELKIRRLAITCRSLGINELVLVDLTTYRVGQYYRHCSESFSFRYYTDFTKAVRDFEGREIIVLDLPGNIKKRGFEPENLMGTECGGDALYVVGPDGINIFDLTDFPAQSLRWVYIPCRQPGLLYAEHALVIALYEHERRR